MITIPLRAVAEYGVNVELDNRPFRMVFKWNYRGQYWTTEFWTRDGVLIHGGIKVVPAADLLHARRHIADLPQGYLMATDTTESGEPIAFDDLGVRLKLIYITREEWEAILAEL